MEINDYTTIIIAMVAIGALVVSILSYRQSGRNLRYTQSHDEVKLQIRPGMYNDGATGLSVGVTNLSSVAVTISSVGIKIGEDGTTFSVPADITPRPPIRLEPRADQSFLFPHFSAEDVAYDATATPPGNRKLSEIFADEKSYVFARTACGKEVQCECDIPWYLKGD